MSRIPSFVLMPTLVLSAAAPAQAGSRWTRLTAENIDDQHLSFAVRTKESEGLRVFEVSVRRKVGELSPLLQADLTVGDGQTPVAACPVERLRRDGGEIAYRFRVGPKFLAGSKFVFAEMGYVRRTDEQGREQVVGMPSGDFYWFRLDEFADAGRPARARDAEPGGGEDDGGVGVGELTPGRLVEVLTRGEGFPPQPRLPAEMRGSAANEIAASPEVRRACGRLAAANLRELADPAAVAALADRKALWCLLSCLASPREDNQIEALRGLRRLGDRRAVPFLLIYAEYMAVAEDGSENATIHGVIHESAAAALSALTGVPVTLDGQDPDGFRRGIRMWRKWLVEQEDARSTGPSLRLLRRSPDGTALNLPHVRRIIAVDPNPGVNRLACRPASQAEIEVGVRPLRGEDGTARSTRR